jgi:AcrR family transcriptional regulator
MGATSGRKGEATRGRIVDTAYQLFLEQGYHGTAMRQIAERAGLTMGGIYNHFPGKEEIWVAVFLAKHPYHEILPVLHGASGDTVAEFVRDAATRLVDVLGKRKDLLNLMFIEIVEFNGRHIGDLFHLILPEFLKLGQQFSRREGKLRALPMPILARSFAGLFFSYYITELMMPRGVQELMGPHALDGFVDIYLHGILDEPEDARHG